MHAPRSPPGESTIFVVIGGPIARGEIPSLCRGLRPLLEEGNAELVVCDVSALVIPDAATVDALARLQLVARRLGSRVRLMHACDQLTELLELMGLREAIPSLGCLPIETRGEPEEREEAGRIQEEGDAADPIA